jgi:hypothetical protein
MPDMPGDDSLVDAFLSRAEKLTPTEWGRLEARGAHLVARTPLSFLQRARIDGAAHGLWNFLPPGAATAAALAVRAAFWTAVRALTAGMLLADPTGKRRKHWSESGGRLAARHAAQTKRRLDRGDEHARLFETCKTHAGDHAWYNSGAYKALYFGFMALDNREMISDEAFATVYAPVEPIIPLASLLQHPLLPPDAASG